VASGASNTDVEAICDRVAARFAAERAGVSRRGHSPQLLGMVFNQRLREVFAAAARLIALRISMTRME
jgi:hypothetical protein